MRFSRHVRQFVRAATAAPRVGVVYGVLGAGLIASTAVLAAAEPAVVDMASYIDHTLLAANATKEKLQKLCEEARQYKFRTVCVNASNVPFCVEQLKGSGVGVCAVVGFPLGATTSEVKAFEARGCIDNGASEIDMVINVGALLSGDLATVKHDIQTVRVATHGYTLKGMRARAPCAVVCLPTDLQICTHTQSFSRRAC